mgnify:CR=1 FL=1
MRIVLIILTFSFLSTGIHAQKVENKAFSKRLKSLLSHTVKEISVKDAAKIQKKAVFLDTRKREEYNISHIKNARWVGYDNFSAKRMKGISKHSTIILYCSVGYRSEKITEKLKKMGYRNISNLYGGIFEWVNQGHKVYDNKTNNTLKVHTYNKRWSKWLKRGVKIY